MKTPNHRSNTFWISKSTYRIRKEHFIINNFKESSKNDNDIRQVVKWGMHHICKLDVSLWPDIGHHDWLHDDFLQGLNHVTLYVRASAGTLPKLAQDLIEYLQKCAQLPLSERQGFFYRFFQGALFHHNSFEFLFMYLISFIRFRLQFNISIMSFDILLYLLL